MSGINAKARADIANFVSKSKNRIQEGTREILIEFGSRLVYRSPIGDPMLWHPPHWPKGYYPGHFINNWQVGIDAKPTGIIDAVDPSGFQSLERLRKLGRWPVGHVYHFANNLPYASLLESGMHSSQVGPGGMVKITMMEFQSIARSVAQKIKSGG